MRLSEVACIFLTVLFALDGSVIGLFLYLMGTCACGFICVLSCFERFLDYVLIGYLFLFEAADL